MTLKTRTATILLSVMIVSGCAGAPPTMWNPQIDTLQSQGSSALVKVYSHSGCKAEGFNKAFTAVDGLQQINLGYAAVMSGAYPQYSKMDIKLASSALAGSSMFEISLLEDIAKQAEKMGCKSIERKAYNQILESPVFGTDIASVFSQNLMIAKTKLSQR